MTTILEMIVLDLIGGTFIWLVWPSAMLAFPGLVSAGYLVSEIGWWSAVCLFILYDTLIKSYKGPKKTPDEHKQGLAKKN